ncbi:MAG: hypothetical protein ACI96N_002804 [Arenicella sp.]|jgi:hypothetical protein
MPEITTVTLNQLNALTRGGLADGLSNSSSLTASALAAKVVVSQVSGNTVTFTNPQTKQSADLPASSLNNLGSIKSGQTFELLSIPNKANTYVLIPTSNATRTNSVPSGAINNTAATSQVLASTNISSNDNQLNAIVGRASAFGEIGVGGKAIVNITGRIINISANQLTLNFQIPRSNIPAQQATITLSPDLVSKLQVNNNLSLFVDISAKQARISSLSVPAALSGTALSTAALSLSPQLAKLNASALPNKLLSAAILQQLGSKQAESQTQQSNSAKSANALNASGAAQGSGTGSGTGSGSQSFNSITIPLTDAKLAQLPKALLSSLQNAISKVNTNGASQVSLLIENTAGASTLKISVIGNINAASAELNTKQIGQLLNNISASANLQIAVPNAEKNSQGNKLSNNILAQGFIANKAQLLNKQDSLNATNPNQAKAKVNTDPLSTSLKNGNPSATAINNQAAPSFKTDLLLEQLLKLISSTPQASKATQNAAAQNTSILTQLLGQLPSSKINAALEQFTHLGATEKTSSPINIDALRNQVQALSKQALSQSASQSQTLSNIINALNTDADIESLGPEAKTLLTNVKELLPALNPAQALSDARVIQQLIGAPLNNAPINALSPTGASGMLSGLVSLLQVSLASKLQRQSNKQASKMQDQLPDVIKSLVPNVTSAQSAKLMQDFRQFDTKHALTAEVAKMLSSHQHHKLKSIESSLQGQDQLHYALPNMFHKNGDDIELLIKRETKENSNEQNADKNASWYLTMKLDVGPLGQMLAKTQLCEDEIKLQLYTSTTELKNKALDMLPYLQKRLSLLGINITDKSCQLGKIPKQLQSEHYQVFETKV